MARFMLFVVPAAFASGVGTSADAAFEYRDDRRDVFAQVDSARRLPVPKW